VTPILRTDNDHSFFPIPKTQLLPENSGPAIPPSDGRQKALTILAVLIPVPCIGLVAYVLHGASAGEKHLALLASGIILAGCAGIVATALAMARRTEQRLLKAEHNQQQMQKQVVEAGKLAAIGELAAGIAHEINNPLAIMMENAGWIQDLLKSEDPYSEENMAGDRPPCRPSASRAIAAGRSRTSSSASPARPTTRRRRGAQVNACWKTSPASPAKKRNTGTSRCRLSLDPEAGEVECSATEIQQIILNLVNNAIDAIEKDDGLVQLRSLREGNFVRIDVQDNGQGIPADILPACFEPFFTTKDLQARARAWACPYAGTSWPGWAAPSASSPRPDRAAFFTSACPGGPDQ
jgi:signal transduction histidine kinase